VRPLIDDFPESQTDFAPGRSVTIAPLVARCVAPNASAMTGPGTNTYLLGNPVCAILDPGPTDPLHLDALAAAAPGARTIFVTHTHRDHSPAAVPLAKRLGARLVGRAPPGDGRQDESFRPDRAPARDERFQLAPNLTLRAIDTPGHASNHVCYLYEQVGLLFSGDHLLDGVTPVILAPDGDMSHYLESLRRLQAYPLRYVAPGHGRLLDEPAALIEQVIAHRGRREQRVIAELTALRAATTDELLPRVYSEVAPALHAFARCSLEAHLVKLERERRCVRDGEQWRVPPDHG
jgi:glyoxylase-like metal-dependent hydrolase (beta-lactamase superfamily II)